MAQIDLFVDQQTQTLVVSDKNGAPFALGALFQSNVQPFTVTVLNQTGNPLAPYSKADCNGLGLRMAIGDTPAGTQGQTPLALQVAWDWDAQNLRFGPASLALNTQDIDDFLGTLAEKLAFLELNLTQNGNRITIYQGQVLIKAVVDELNASVPVPTDSYYTKNDADATFMPLKLKAGQGITLRSLNGKKVVIYLKDQADGSATVQMDPSN